MNECVCPGVRQQENDVTVWLWLFRYDICDHFIPICALHGIFFIIITLVNKWQTEIHLLVVIDTYNRYNRIGLTSGLIVSFGGETGGTPLRDFPESSAYKNEAPKWRLNPDTKPMKTKTLIGFSKSYYVNYVLGAELHKQNSINHHCTHTWEQASISLYTNPNI